MDAENYAKALISAAKTEKDTDALLAHFLDVLKKRGVLGLLPKILTILEHAINRDKSQKATLVLARDSDKDKILEAVGDDFGKISTLKEDLNIKIDESIIGGYRLETSGDLIDESYKSRLLSIYRAVKAS